MPKSKHRKGRRNSHRSSIEQHRQSGKELIPPAMQGMEWQFMSWMNDRLPEMLWASLIFAEYERTEAFREFQRILGFVRDHERKEGFYDLTISGFAELGEELRSELIWFIAANPRTSRALASLTMFESLPKREEWEAALSGYPPSLDLLMTAVGSTVFHQSPMATDCRWVRMIAAVIAGKVHINRSMEDYIETLFNYPELEPGAPEGGRIRATEGGLTNLSPLESSWPKDFWKEAWEKTDCFQIMDPSNKERIRTSTTRQGLDDLVGNLNEHWTQTHSATAVNAKHDAVFGIAFFTVRILIEMMSFGTSNGILGRLGLRTILENRINLKYLIDKNDDALWEQWRRHGAGQAKLSSLKVDDLESTPEFIDLQSIEHIASEDLWEELLTIDLGHWADGDLRNMSQNTQLKETYDQYYPWTSAYSHGAWGAIRETSFQTCGNPLHRLHRYPERQPLQDCLYDAVSLVDQILTHLDNEYPSFTHRLLPSI